MQESFISLVFLYLITKSGRSFVLSFPRWRNLHRTFFDLFLEHEDL